MQKPILRSLSILLLLYGAASLVHFVHNAEFLAEYPNMPATWSRVDVYFAWIGMTIVGLAGWFLVVRGFNVTGLLCLLVYAGLGLDSLGHYVLAPIGMHSAMMNATILAEVTCAAVVLVVAMRLLAMRMLMRRQD
jgi:hypothetical protein